MAVASPVPLLCSAARVIVIFVTFQANGADGKMKNLPVPVFLRPLDEKDPSMKVVPPHLYVEQFVLHVSHACLGLFDCCYCVSA